MHSQRPGVVRVIDFQQDMLAAVRKVRRAAAGLLIPPLPDDRFLTFIMPMSMQDSIEQAAYEAHRGHTMLAERIRARAGYGGLGAERLQITD